MIENRLKNQVEEFKNKYGIENIQIGKKTI